ncbi:unnamed protein product [Owenia fusiformis]|uniref:RRP1 n=1 Tax=Owenia fusiformis TaxID=6347 RepID=A0A8S4PVL6_OWEFU|nr:unnamed protein product [Owenia fusiformis]
MANLPSEIEVQFAQKLASNEKKYRDRAVKKLRKWIEIRSSQEVGGFTEEQLVKIWKGLHYCMWMADKPLIQEDLADSLASLMHAFKTHDGAIQYIDIFIQTICREWFGIDRLRLDKFMMLMRRTFRQSLQLLKAGKWKKPQIESLLEVFKKMVINGGHNAAPDGVRFHFADMYLDELTTAGAEELSSEETLMFLKPYMEVIAITPNKALRDHVVNNVFNEIILEAVQKVEDEAIQDEDEEDEETDAKLQYNYTAIATSLFELAADSKKSLPRNRPILYQLRDKFTQLSQGTLPVEDLSSGSDDSLTEEHVIKATKRLQKFYTNTQEKESRAEKRKRRKQQRLEMMSDMEEPAAKKSKTDERTDTSPPKDIVKTKKKNKFKDKTNVKNKAKDTGDSTGEDLDELTTQESIENPPPLSNKKKLKKKRKLEIDESSAISNVNNDNEIQQNDTPVEEVEAPKSSKKEKKLKNKENIENVATKEPTLESTPSLPKKMKLKDQPKTPDVIKSSSKKKAKKLKTDVESSSTSDKLETPKTKTLKHDSKKLVKSSSKKALKKNKAEATTNDSPKVKLFETSEKTKDMDTGSNTKKNEGGNLEEEVEIWIPNKKYKAKTEEPTLNIKKKKQSPKTENKQQFATFTKVQKTPPAFVKKSMDKLKTPKTEPKKHKLKNIGEVPGSAPNTRSRRISFGKPKVQAYAESLIKSPKPAFDPDAKPENGILKTPPNKIIFSKVKTPKSGKLHKHSSAAKSGRSKAADFF